MDEGKIEELKEKRKRGEATQADLDILEQYENREKPVENK